ncbi:hypothetical protein JKP88DRAFT_255127 [Tribonema minus]|uniref:Uncharacterized protein n=1 Tax=Tribonema minus TaxID=303371 RepID=A0A836CIS0_9STRA|nr:hypothetical protein JKP88DRAFT_255127 [Tribonema minus]
MRNEWASNPALLSGGAQQHAPNPQQWLTGVNQPAPEPQPMPEPSHRVGPPGVSSGVSLRHLPDTTFKAVAAICQHYEEKCSGKYASDSAAARYVFDLSREVQSQLAALEAQAQDREARVASLSSTLSSHLPTSSERRPKQTLACAANHRNPQTPPHTPLTLDATRRRAAPPQDWDASFGAASPLARDADALRLPLPAGGASPANVARALRAQALRIHELEAQLGGARAAADAVTADARAALVRRELGGV